MPKVAVVAVSLAAALCAALPAQAGYGAGVLGALQSAERGYDITNGDTTVHTGPTGTTVSTGDATVNDGPSGTTVSTDGTNVSTGPSGTTVSTDGTNVSTGSTGTTVSTGGTSVSTGSTGTTVSTGGTNVSTGSTGTSVSTGGSSAPIGGSDGGFSTPGAVNAQVERLFAAANQGDLRTVNQLLLQGVPVSSVDGTGRTLLHVAAQSHQPDLATTAINRGAAVDARDRMDMTPLMYAAIKNDTEMMRAFLAAGANPHATGFKSQDGPAQSTPLILASEMGALGAVQLLLDRGANVNYVNNFKRTALYWAEKAGKRDVAERLRAYGASVEGVPGSAPGGNVAAASVAATAEGIKLEAQKELVKVPIVISSSSRQGFQPQSYDEKLVRYVIAALTLGADANHIFRNRARDANMNQAVARFARGVRAANAGKFKIVSLDGEPAVVRKEADPNADPAAYPSLVPKPIDGWDVILTSDPAYRRLTLE